MNAVLFWLIGAALLAGLLYSLLKTLRRPPQASTPGTEEQTLVSIYQNRLQLAQQQFDNGELDALEYEQAKQELSNALALELQNPAPVKSKPAPAIKPGKSGAWTLGIALPLLAVSLYLLLGRPAALDPAAETAQLSIPEMVARLERRLKSNPEDVQGWRMLARSYSVLENYAAARDAYGEIYKREPGNVLAILDYAEATARASGNDIVGRPAELIDEALQHDPAHPRGLILKGVALFQQDDPAGAVRMWQTVIAQPEVDQETRTVVQGLIDQARQLAGASAPPETVAPAPAAAARSSAAVTVELSLAPQFAAAVSPEDTVFVFAQAATGPKMPLAVARRRVGELPLKLVLDDSSAMTQGMNLSAFNQVIVSARVSKSGNATAASGDLQGKSAVLDPAKKPSITLVIDTKLP